MLCKTPNTKAKNFRRKRAAPGDPSFGFIVADVSDLLYWSENNNVTFGIYEDPEYVRFESNPRMKEGTTLLIMVGIIYLFFVF